MLIDTAGIRRRGKVASGPAAERYSTLRALSALSRADVAVLVIDAVDGLTSQDAHVAGYAIEEGKGLVIAVNKWDIVEDKTDRTFDEYSEWIRDEVPFIDFAPDRVDQRPDRAAGRAGPRIGRRHLGRAPPPDPDRRTQSIAHVRHRPDPAAARPWQATEAVLRDPGRHRAADVRVLRLEPRRSTSRTGATSRTDCATPFGFDGTPIRLVFRDRAKDPVHPSSGDRRHEEPEGRQGRQGRQEGDRARQAAPQLMAAPLPAPRIAVIGAGAWGTTLAAIVGRREPVTLLCHDPAQAEAIESSRRNERRLPGVDLPATVVATVDPAALADAVDLVIVAVPSTHVRSELSRLAPHIPESADVLSVVKGLERGSLLRMSEVIADAGSIAPERIAALSARTSPMRSPATCRHRRSSPRPTSSWRSGSRPGSAGAASGCT